MKRTFVPVITFLALGLGLATYAQQPGPSRQAPPGQAPGAQSQPRGAQPGPPDADRSAGQGERISVTGCLAKASQANQYTITDSSSHEKYTFPGPSQLDRYVNQTVKLTGSMESGDHGEKIFHPESLAPVSTSCS